ncbi:protein kinase, partial [Candidatus Woesearchaeota archaeon]|nr:protein kinase [Candidatus Woesearchaeota archaeon]
IKSDFPEKIAGTPSHAAPEQLNRELREVKEKVDGYGLATVFYEMLALKIPVTENTKRRLVGYDRELKNLNGFTASGYVGEDLKQFTVSVDTELNNVVMGALNLDPDNRPSITRLRQVFEKFSEKESQEGRIDIGTVIDRRYEVTEKLARGGMGQTWLAYDRVNEKQVVVKTLALVDAFGSLIEPEDEEFGRDFFMGEALQLKKMHNRNIVGYIDSAARGDNPYIIQEYIEGRTLDDILNEQNLKKEALDLIVASEYSLQVLEAMKYMRERKVVHRDLKPSNIIIDSKGTVKIIDFGLSKFEGDFREKYSNRAIGSLRYLAPEQAEASEEKEDETTWDLYSAATIFYEMLTRRNPIDFGGLAVKFGAELRAPEVINNEIPQELSDAIVKALSVNPDDRGSIEDLEQQFVDVVAEHYRDIFEAIEVRPKTGAEVNVIGRAIKELKQPC